MWSEYPESNWEKTNLFDFVLSVVVAGNDASSNKYATECTSRFFSVSDESKVCRGRTVLLFFISWDIILQLHVSYAATVSFFQFYAEGKSLSSSLSLSASSASSFMALRSKVVRENSWSWRYEITSRFHVYAWLTSEGTKLAELLVFSISLRNSQNPDAFDH